MSLPWATVPAPLEQETRPVHRHGSFPYFIPMSPQRQMGLALKLSGIHFSLQTSPHLWLPGLSVSWALSWKYNLSGTWCPWQGGQALSVPSCVCWWEAKTWCSKDREDPPECFPTAPGAGPGSWPRREGAVSGRRGPTVPFCPWRPVWSLLPWPLAGCTEVWPRIHLTAGPPKQPLWEMSSRREGLFPERGWRCLLFSLWPWENERR